MGPARVARLSRSRRGIYTRLSQKGGMISSRLFVNLKRRKRDQVFRSSFFSGTSSLLVGMIHGAGGRIRVKNKDRLIL